MRCYNNILAAQGFESPFDQYKILGECPYSEGSSTILLAKHKSNGSKVCIKVIYKDVGLEIDVAKVPFLAIN